MVNIQTSQNLSNQFFFLFSSLLFSFFLSSIQKKWITTTPTASLCWVFFILFTPLSFSGTLPQENSTLFYGYLLLLSPPFCSEDSLASLEYGTWLEPSLDLPLPLFLAAASSFPGQISPSLVGSS